MTETVSLMKSAGAPGLFMADIGFLIAAIAATLSVSGVLWAFGVIADPEQEEMWLVTSQELEQGKVIVIGRSIAGPMKRTTA